MSPEKRKSGKIGEEAAAAFLRRKGYQIIERNYRNKLGEIDIIARDGGVLAFIEVRTKSSEAFGSPFESITKQKQKKLGQVSQSYLKMKQMTEADARFDVVAVFLAEHRCQRIELIKNAFEFY